MRKKVVLFAMVSAFATSLALTFALDFSDYWEATKDFIENVCELYEEYLPDDWSNLLSWTESTYVEGVSSAPEPVHKVDWYIESVTSIIARYSTGSFYNDYAYSYYPASSQSVILRSGLSAPQTAWVANYSMISMPNQIYGVAMQYSSDTVSFGGFNANAGVSGYDFSAYCFTTTVSINNPTSEAITIYNDIDGTSKIIQANSTENFVFYDLFGSDHNLWVNGLLATIHFSESDFEVLTSPGYVDFDNITYPPVISVPEREKFPDDISYNQCLSVYNYVNQFRDNLVFLTPMAPLDSWVPSAEKLKEYPLFSFPLMMVEDLYDTCKSGYSSTFDFKVDIDTDFFDIDEDFHLNPTDLFGTTFWSFITYVFAFFMFYLLFHHLWDNIVTQTEEVDIQ